MEVHFEGILQMLEYVFFDRRPFQRFVEFLRKHGLDPVIQVEDELYEVQLPEDLDEQLSEHIEKFYDEMLELNQRLFDQEQAADTDYHAAGVVVNLQSGLRVYANVNPELLGKIMSVLTPQEFGVVVNAIIDAVEPPDERSMCQRMALGAVQK